jgi:serine/threonine protein kinase
MKRSFAATLYYNRTKELPERVIKRRKLFDLEDICQKIEKSLLICKNGNTEVHNSSDNKNVYKITTCKNVIDCGLIYELYVLNNIRHPNIIKSDDITYKNNDEKIIFKIKMIKHIELLAIIRKEAISLERRKKWIWQLANAIRCLHAKKIIYCDIKPDNILIDKNDNLILCDFNCVVHHDREDKKINIINNTRVYTSPELLYGESMNFGIDIWGLGVILSILISRKWICKNKKSSLRNDNLNQLRAYVRLLGFPEDKKYSQISTHLRLLMKNIKLSKESNVLKQIKTSDFNEADLLSKTLCWNLDRISLTNFLQHPYFSSFHSKINLLNNPISKLTNVPIIQTKKRIKVLTIGFDIYFPMVKCITFLHAMYLCDRYYYITKDEWDNNTFQGAILICQSLNTYHHLHLIKRKCLLSETKILTILKYDVIRPFKIEENVNSDFIKCLLKMQICSWEELLFKIRTLF